MATQPDVFQHTFALVTGASSGLGLEFARQLAARGANLILAARSIDKLEATARELAAVHGVDARALRADLAAPGGAEALCAAVGELGVFVAHLVNNAGFGTAGPFLRAERQGEMVRLNCEALTVLSQHFLREMAERRCGGVIHVASIAGFQPTPYMATYAASKAYVLTLSVALSEELRGRGVRVLALCPGPVPTGFQGVAGTAIRGPMKVASLTAEETVFRALDAYEDGRAVCVPGTVNRVSAVSARLLPLGLISRVAAAVMRRSGRARDLAEE
jgi:hypothetical protein